MVNVYINLTYLLHKEIVHSLERINIFMELFLRELYFWRMYTIFWKIYYLKKVVPPFQCINTFNWNYFLWKPVLQKYFLINKINLRKIIIKLPTIYFIGFYNNYLFSANSRLQNLTNTVCIKWWDSVTRLTTEKNNKMWISQVCDCKTINLCLNNLKDTED